MPLRTIKEDNLGIYISHGCEPCMGKARPGPISGWNHVYQCGDFGLKKGDKVKAHHRSQTSLMIIDLGDNVKRAWEITYPDYIPLE